MRRHHQYIAVPKVSSDFIISENLQLHVARILEDISGCISSFHETVMARGLSFFFFIRNIWRVVSWRVVSWRFAHCAPFCNQDCLLSCGRPIPLRIDYLGSICRKRKNRYKYIMEGICQVLKYVYIYIQRRKSSQVPAKSRYVSNSACFCFEKGLLEHFSGERGRTRTRTFWTWSLECVWSSHLLSCPETRRAECCYSQGRLGKWISLSACNIVSQRKAVSPK